MSNDILIAPNSDESISLEPGGRAIVLILRLIILILIVSLLTMHVRSLRVFRWEQSVTGGILVTYTVASLGLAICAGVDDCGGLAFQTYISGTGAVSFAVNSAILWRRWQNAGELTRIVAELLITLGLQLKRQLRWKMGMSAVVSALLLLDMALTPLIPQSHKLILIGDYETNRTTSESKEIMKIK